MVGKSVASLFLLFLFLCATESQEEAKAPTVIGLRADHLIGVNSVEAAGILYREMLRQSVLIAARDELGLFTRDQALREPLPEGGGTLGFNIQITADRQAQLSLTSGDGEGKKILWKMALDIPAGKLCSVHELAPLVEPLSRGPLVDALKQAGFPGRQVKRSSDGALPEGVERRLREMTFTEAYAALRQLHSACRETGESPARLGALVRAYANLGQLCRGLWNASSKVLAARSILYAQRLLVVAPGTRMAHWHRSYALTLAGLHKAALDDLAAAQALPDSKETMPVWVPWLEACCRYETPKLEGDAPAEDRPLQRFLAYLTVEASGSGVWERGKAIEVLKLSPECYRIIDATCAIGGVNNLHGATMLGPKMLGSRIYGRVKSQPDVPKGVLDAIRALDQARSEQEGRVVLWKALLASPDAGEPSWPLLGRLIEETSFMQTVRRGEFMRHQWSVPCDEFVKEATPLIAEHPYGALVRSYVLDARRQPRDWNALFESIRLGDVTEDLLPLSSATWNVPGKTPLGRRIWSSIWSHLDATAPDLRWGVEHFTKEQVDNRRKYAGLLLDLSPHSPAAIVELIRHDWPRMESRVVELEKALGHHPSFLQALGRKYFDLKKMQDAERCFRREIEIAPNADASFALAKIYLEGGEEEKWRVTMEAALKGEEYGLEHARIQVELARYYMKSGRFEKAEPYAAAAAESWASWAMDCARDCYEKMGDWKKAELWQRRTSERYDNHQMEWFFWCKRNDKGELEAAAALAEQFIAGIGPRATAADLERIGIFYALTGKGKESLAAFQKSSQSTNDPYVGLHAALAAMALQDGAARDAALSRVLEKGPAFLSAKGRKGLEVELAREFRKTLDQGAGVPADAKVFERLLQGADAPNKVNASFFIGRFLELHGSPAEARPYYENGLKAAALNYNYLLIRDALKRKP